MFVIIYTKLYSWCNWLFNSCVMVVFPMQKEIYIQIACLMMVCYILSN